MATSELKQHVPIFVGSTYENLQYYRAAVNYTLHRLETIVRGMEYFGSKPGTPLDECLSAVRSCRVYIGIFAMRYGSVPSGHNESMTHLEYMEAQRSGLPSLIYLIDEANQPILPKYVETGDGAKKLQALKEQLRLKHTVSVFTTPDSLSSGILHDLPPVLQQIGTKIDGTIKTEEPGDSVEILGQFALLPKLWQGKELVVEFIRQGGFGSVEPNRCTLLSLDVGATVRGRIKLHDRNDWDIYAEGDQAKSLIAIPKGAMVKLKVITLFAVEFTTEYNPQDGDYTTHRTIIKGLLAKEIISVTQSKSGDKLTDKAKP